MNHDLMAYKTWSLGYGVVGLKALDGVFVYSLLSNRRSLSSVSK